MRKTFMKRLTRRLNILTAAHIKKVMTIKHVISYLPKKRTRKVWCKQRSKQWWYKIVKNKTFDDQMTENFRMDRESFNFICEKLAPYLAPKPYVVHALPVDMIVAIAIYKLASCAEYRVIANQFGVHKSTVLRCLHNFCDAMLKKFLKEEITMPKGARAQSIIEGFKEKCGIPQILGAIDGTHIPVTAPLEGHSDFINRKGWPSIILQAVVDCNYRFIDIACKHPGSAHDATVLKDSFFYRKMEQLDLPVENIDGKEIRAFFLGDPAYPLQPWLLKGYLGNITPEEDSFNAYLNKGRIVVENEFGRLKGRWRILQKRIDVDINFVPTVVATCCILHNLLEKRKAPYTEMWTEVATTSENILQQPSCETQMISLEGTEIRNHLKQYMNNNLPLIQSLKKK